jgi:transketolase
MAIDEQELRPDVVVHRHHGRQRGDVITALSINTIRALAIDAVEAAGSGHPGTPMALAPLGHLLFTRFLKQDPTDPDWPGLVVLRPADANETAAAWRTAVARLDGPTALALTRQKVPTLPAPPPGAVARGAYIRAHGDDIALVATGSEVHLAMAARDRLAEADIAARVVAMPSWELFDDQPAAYRDEVLPPWVPGLAVEAGRGQGWCRYTDDVVSIESFGASAPAPDLFEAYGLTADRVARRAQSLLERTGYHAIRSGGPT